MMLWRSRAVSIGVLLATIAALAGMTSAALAADPAMPPAPKFSTIVPAADLAGQVDWYIKDLEASVATQEDYKDSVEKIAKESNTLVVIALALGLHDEPSKYQAAAGHLMKAAQAVAATKDYDASCKAVAALRKASKTKGNAELKWEKVASLPELMKQVPNINTNLKRNLKPNNFKKKAKVTAGYTAAIAAIAQGSMADTSATKNADQVTQWYKFSAAMRDDAGAVNAAIHQGDEPAAAKAMKKLGQSCEDCHAVFHPEAKAVLESGEKSSE
jgi:hypothetical protein